MHITPTLLLTLAATATAAPQFIWPWGGGGGSSSGSTTNTANDITNKTPCKALTVIFARGTSERGNIGSVIGPPLRTALQARVGADKVNYQGVPYAASAAVSPSLSSPFSINQSGADSPHPPPSR